MKNTYQYSSINQLDEGDGIVSKNIDSIILQIMCIICYCNAMHMFYLCL